jgi:hypothetical protein
MYAIDPETVMPYGALKVPTDPVKGVAHAEMLNPETVQATTELPLALTINALLPEIAIPAGESKVPATEPVKGVAQLLIASPETVQAVIELSPLLLTYMVVPVEWVESAMPRTVSKLPPVKGVAQVVMAPPEIVQEVMVLSAFAI